MLVASRQGRDMRVLARVMLLAGIGATIAANVGYGLHAGLTGALLSVWPVAAYVGCMELLTWMRRNTGMHRRRGRICGCGSGCTDELARRRHTDGRPAGGGRASLPRCRGRQRPVTAGDPARLRIGQGKAQQVQAHLAGRPADAV